MKKVSIIYFLFAFPFSGFAQLGIGTITPDSNAVLDITSTTLGLLPPRMNTSQRDAINSPPTGLIIYCYDCGGGEPEYYNGTAWTNIIGGPAAQILSIGDDYGGGKVAYILQPGDPGYIAGQVHGLIAAVADQSMGIQWYNGSNIVTGATATGLGTGNANTNTIVAVQGAGSYAAKLCSDLVLNNYSDWYLPSKVELNKLNLNLTAIGGFTNGFYWSSSELNSIFAWAENFANSAQLVDQKNDVTVYVRAVRTF